MARTKNATQVKPTAGEIKLIWKCLKQKANAGDVTAMIGLIDLSMKQKEFERLALRDEVLLHKMNLERAEGFQDELHERCRHIAALVRMSDG